MVLILSFLLLQEKYRNSIFQAYETHLKPYEFSSIFLVCDVKDLVIGPLIECSEIFPENPDPEEYFVMTISQHPENRKGQSAVIPYICQF